MHASDTIAAIASAAGGAARGIVRISGPQAIPIASSGWNSPVPLGDIREPTAVSGQLRLPELHSPLPVTLYCWPDARSYTRQPTVEIHTLGSPPLVELVLQHALRSGARLAEPGEFTLRSFLAGRLDLTQAEAVLGLIDARHQRQFDTALVQLAGGLSTPLARLREQLLELLAHLEAGLDFATEDIQFISADELDAQLRSAAEHVSAIAAQMQTRREANDIPRVVLYGWPNVGKSSLFNALTRQEHALVSPLSGTTRDYLAAELHSGGFVCRLIDTAGVEPSRGDPTISAAAQQMRDEQQAVSQLNLLCLDCTRPLNDWERQELFQQEPDDRGKLVVLTKADGPRLLDAAPQGATATSAATGEGLPRLLQRLKELLTEEGADLSAVASTAARCGESLRLAAECLERARALAIGGGFEELVAAEVRAALVEIGKVVGAVYTDDVLDRIFSRFCIGK